MAKDSVETSDQFTMVEIRHDQQIRHQKSVEQDRKDLARMGKKQVLKVRPQYQSDACTFNAEPL